MSATFNRNAFDERCLDANLTAAEWRLAVALGLSILGYWDSKTKAYKTEARLGEAFLRSTAGEMDGRTFQRARASLIEKGVILRFESSEKGGRGKRSLYVLEEAPALKRELGTVDNSETLADTPAQTAAVTPAQIPAQTPALERGRTKELMKKKMPDGLEAPASTEETEGDQDLEEQARLDRLAGFRLCCTSDCENDRLGGSLYCAECAEWAAKAHFNPKAIGA